MWDAAEFIVPETCLAARGDGGGAFHRHRALAAPFDNGEFRVWVGQDVRAKEFEHVQSIGSHTRALKEIISSRRAIVLEADRRGCTGPTGGEPGCFPTVNIHRTAPSGDVALKAMSLRSSVALIDAECQSEFGNAPISPSGSIAVYGAPAFERTGVAGGEPRSVNAFERICYKDGNDNVLSGREDKTVRLKYSICPSKHRTDPVADQTTVFASADSTDDCAAGTNYVPLSVRSSQKQLAESGEASTDSALADHTDVTRVSGAVPFEFGDEVFIAPQSLACSNVNGAPARTQNWRDYAIFNVRVCADPFWLEDPAVDSAKCAVTRVKIYRTEFARGDFAALAERPTRSELIHSAENHHRVLGGEHLNVDAYYLHSARVSMVDGGNSHSTFGLRFAGDWLQRPRQIVKYTIGGRAARSFDDTFSEASFAYFGSTLFQTSLRERDGLRKGTLFQTSASISIPLFVFNFLGIDLQIDFRIVGALGARGSVQAESSARYMAPDGTFGRDVDRVVRRLPVGDRPGEPAEQKNDGEIVSGRIKHTTTPFAALQATVSASAGLGFARFHVLALELASHFTLIEYSIPWTQETQWELGRLSGSKPEVVMKALHETTIERQISTGNGALRIVLTTGAGIPCLWHLMSSGVLICNTIDLWGKDLMSWSGKSVAGRVFNEKRQTAIAPQLQPL